MGHETAETTHNINNASGPGTANEHAAQWWFKKFRKEDESLKDAECSGWPLEAGNDQLRAIIETNPLTTIQEVAEELNINHSIAVQHLKQNWEGEKACMWVPHERTKYKTSHCFEGSSSLILCNNDHFLIRLSCAMKSGFYMIAGDNHLSAGTKKQLQSTSQSKTSTPKKVMVTVWWSAAHLIHYSFLNPDEIIIPEKYAQQINEML